MGRKRFQKSPFWELSYSNPGLEKRVTKVFKSLKELDGMLEDAKGKGKKKKK